jgi:hypothetical protein
MHWRSRESENHGLTLSAVLEGRPKTRIVQGHVISNTNLNLDALTVRFIDAMKENIASRYC